MQHDEGADMNDDELRDYANTQEVWAKRTRTALNNKIKTCHHLRDTGASDTLVDDIEAHHDGVIEKHSVPFHVDTNPDGEPTRQDILDRRALASIDPE
jgi:hypothetical protein